MFETSPGILWMDASVRLMKNLTGIYSQVLDTDGFLQFGYCFHSNIATTDPRLYSYISTNVKRQRNVPCLAATAILWYRTKDAYMSLFHWWLMCALDEDCIAPKGSTLLCNFGKYSKTRYAGCHRYDQSVLNLLTSNHLSYNVKKYLSRDPDVLKFIKEPSSMYTVKQCPSYIKSGIVPSTA